MKLLLSISCALCLSLFSSLAFGQMAEYRYQREINGVTDAWHKIVLPNALFGKASQSLADLRIYGLTASGDTIEAPYLLRLTTEKTSRQVVAFNTLNTAHNDQGHYFTFEIPSQAPINQIDLSFKQKNFDWRINLEGSHDQTQWFTVLEHYRILSIKNRQADFQFTKLSFPDANYRFFRVFIDSSEKPELSVAHLAQHETTEGTLRKYPVKKFGVKQNQQSKQTEINVELQVPVRVSHVKLAVSDTFDYYRPVTVKYLSDSVKTEQGWKYNFRTLTRGTVNSLEPNEFRFSSQTLQQLKIYIDNHDNQPLSLDTVEVKGYLHELVARFSSPASYYLAYGNPSATRANYDIERFSANIPETLVPLDLGAESAREKAESPVVDPLFKNETWLWAIMIVIIGLLGWFSVKMMRKG